MSVDSNSPAVNPFRDEILCILDKTQDPRQRELFFLLVAYSDPANSGLTTSQAQELLSRVSGTQVNRVDVIQAVSALCDLGLATFKELPDKSDSSVTLIPSSKFLAILASPYTSNSKFSSKEEKDNGKVKDRDRGLGEGEGIGREFQKPEAEQVGTSHASANEDSSGKEPTKKRGSFFDGEKINASELTRKLVEFWGKRSGRKKARFLERRAVMVRCRLQEGYSPDDLFRAIAGVCYSEFHKEGGYDTFEVALRNGAQVEKGIHLWMLHAPIKFIVDYQDRTGEIIECRKRDAEAFMRARKRDESLANRIEQIKASQAEEQARQVEEESHDTSATSIALSCIE